MSKTIEGRTHGDGRLMMSEAFFELTNEEYDHYLELLRTIISRLNLNETLVIDDATPTDLRSTVLALKQKFEIAYSNGCPWPEKATVDRITSEISRKIAIDTSYVVTLKEINDMIVESRNEDGRASFLFGLLIDSASESLREELLSYQPWEKIEGQEDNNLPVKITNENEGYGLANSRPYDSVVLPILRFIGDKAKGDRFRTRYGQVIEFLGELKYLANSLEELEEKVKFYFDFPE